MYIFLKRFCVRIFKNNNITIYLNSTIRLNMCMVYIQIKLIIHALNFYVGIDVGIRRQSIKRC